jgi:hypothetical protein
MDTNLKMMENETQDQYFYRICMMKETLGFTWPQMAEIFNKEFGCNKGDTAYRKRWAAFKDVFEANEDRLVGENAYLDEINAAKNELEKARQKLYATKIEASRNIRQESRAELFYENVRNAIVALPTPEVTYRIDEVCKSDKEYVLSIADIQAGAKFKLDCNEYSLEICKNRFNDLLSLVVDYILENHVFKLHVVELGDTIQGMLRLSDLKLNETSVVEATVTVARLIANFLNELSEYCYIEYYHTPLSNHSQTRNLGSKANELMFEDMEYVIGHYIKDMLHLNDSVHVHLHDGYDYIDIPIFNYNVTAMHGHTIKNLENALMDISATRRKFIDYLLIGHWHNGRVIPGNEHGSYDTEVLMCPSFQGTDPYAFNKLGKSSKAACKMFIFDKKHGCTGTEKFILN